MSRFRTRQAEWNKLTRQPVYHVSVRARIKRMVILLFIATILLLVGSLVLPPHHIFWWWLLLPIGLCIVFATSLIISDISARHKLERHNSPT